MARMTNFRSAAIATGNAINDSAYDNVKKVADQIDAVVRVGQAVGEDGFIEEVDIVASKIDKVETTALRIDEVEAVGLNLLGPDTIGAVALNLISIGLVNDNKVNIDTVANDLQLGVDSKIKVVKDNIDNVNLTAANIGSIVALESNYDEIITANENANFGVMNAINLSANVIGVNATVATGQNGVSFGTMTIEEGVTVTVEEGSEWAVL